MAKDRVKLLLNLVCAGDHGAAARRRDHRSRQGAAGQRRPSTCAAGAPAPGRRTISSSSLPAAPTPPLDTMTIQPYYTARLAGSAGMRLEVVKDGADIVLAAA